MNLGPYSKTVTALVTGVIGWAGVVISSEAAKITASEWLGLAVAAATALGVFAVPNGPAQVQVVNPPEDPVVVENARAARPLRAERGAVDVASAAVGFLLALAFVVLFAELTH